MGAQNKVVDIESRNMELISFTQKEVETIKRTVASDANTDELRMFLHIAKPMVWIHLIKRYFSGR